MKFHKMLKLMLKDPKLQFKSASLFCDNQDLYSIKYWFTKSRGAKDRARYFDQFTKAEDWQINTEENPYDNGSDE